MMARRGFTLIEMLVATAIFAVGFTALYAMFLAGMRNRALAEATTRTSLAANSLIGDMRLACGTERAGTLPASSLPPLALHYIGDGDAENGAEVAGADMQDPASISDADVYDEAGRFFARDDGSGVFIRVLDASDLSGDRDGDGAIRVTVLAAHLAIPRDSVSIAELRRRRRVPIDGAIPMSVGEQVIRDLERRHILHRYDAVIHRRVPWAP